MTSPTTITLRTKVVLWLAVELGVRMRQNTGPNDQPLHSDTYWDIEQALADLYAIHPDRAHLIREAYTFGRTVTNLTLQEMTTR